MALALASGPFLSCASVGKDGSGQAEFTDCTSCPEMLSVPAGFYVMGDSTGEGSAHELPPRPVTIEAPFAIGKFPITVEQFQEFVTASGYVTEAERNPDEGCWGVRDDLSVGWLPNRHWNNNPLGQTARHPVVCVSRDDARHYAQWLSRTSGFDYRLPSEAEWEYAARAGATGKYYFNDALGDVCAHINHADLQMIKAWDADTGVSTCDDGFLTTSPVGHFPANAWGLYDVYGNVWEWMEDCYRPHLREVGPGRQAVAGSPCDKHTLRGASWASRPAGITTSYRISSEPQARTVDYGFRVVRESAAN